MRHQYHQVEMRSNYVTDCLRITSLEQIKGKQNTKRTSCNARWW